VCPTCSFQACGPTWGLSPEWSGSLAGWRPEHPVCMSLSVSPRKIWHFLLCHFLGVSAAVLSQEHLSPQDTMSTVFLPHSPQPLFPLGCRSARALSCCCGGGGGTTVLSSPVQCPPQTGTEKVVHYLLAPSGGPLSPVCAEAPWMSSFSD
jgi:hypothetical protein